MHVLPLYNPQFRLISALLSGIVKRDYDKQFQKTGQKNGGTWFYGNDGSGMDTLSYSIGRQFLSMLGFRNVWYRRTKALDKGNHYVFNGTKNWITNGKYAVIHLMVAVTSPIGDQEPP